MARIYANDSEGDRVEKVGRTLLDVGASDYLKAALKHEEDRLRDLRQKLAAAVQRQPRPEAKLDIERVATVMQNLTDVAVGRPAFHRGRAGGRGDAEKRNGRPRRRPGTRKKWLRGRAREVV